MDRRSFTRATATGILVLLILDVVWVYFYMTPKYSTMIRSVQGSSMTPNPVYAILAYFLMVVGFGVFVMDPLRYSLFRNDHVKYQDTIHMVARAALFGYVLYGVYNMTCATVFSKWNMGVAVQDILWGSFVYAVATAVAIYVV